MSDIHKLSEIFIAMRNQLARSVLRIAPPETVEDIVQESYVRLCQIDQQEVVQNPRAYLYQTVRNLALDQLKRHEYKFGGSVEVDTLPHPLEDTTFREASSQEEFGRFCEAVRQLPLQCRRVFVLKKVYNYSQAEIANELGISQSTVEKHVGLGIRRCREYMKENQKTEQVPKTAFLSETKDI